MKFQKFIVSGLLLCAISAFAGPKKPVEKMAETPLVGTTVEEKIQSVFDKYNADLVISRILERQMAGDLRHGVDRVMADQIETLPHYDILRAQAQVLIEQIIAENQIALSSSVAKAKNDPNGQYSEYLEMVRRVAAKQKFPVSARENAVVHVDPTSQVNAYTYSGGPGIYFVILRGLVESFDKGSIEAATNLKEEYGIDLPAKQISDMAVEAVIGHEIGHIKAGHIRNQIIFTSLVEASMRAFAREHDQGLDKEAQASRHSKFAEIHNKVMVELERSIVHEKFGNKESRTARTLTAASRAKLHDNIQVMAEMLLNKMGSKQILTKMLRINSVANPKSAPRGSKRNMTEEEFNQIVALFEKWGRHAETTSDRIGQISTSTMAAKFADLLLGGGLSMKSMEAQAQELRDQLMIRPELEAAISAGSHPATLMRLLAYDHFEKDPMHKVYSTPYLTAMHTLSAVSMMIETLQNAQDNDNLEAAGNWMAGVDKDRLIKFEEELTALVVGEIEKDMDNPSRKLETITETVKYLNYRVEEHRLAKRGRYNRGIALRMNKEGGLFFQLQQITMKRSLAIVEKLAAKVNEVDTNFQKKMSEGVDGKSLDAHKEAQLEKNKKAILAELRNQAQHELKQLIAIVQPLLVYAPVSPLNESKANLKRIAHERDNGDSSTPVTIEFKSFEQPTQLTIRIPSIAKLRKMHCSLALGENAASPEFGLDRLAKK